MNFFNAWNYSWRLQHRWTLEFKIPADTTTPACLMEINSLRFVSFLNAFFLYDSLIYVNCLSNYEFFLSWGFVYTDYSLG